MRHIVAVIVAGWLVFGGWVAQAGSWNGWVYQDPYPTDVNLFDVKFVTPEEGWITGKYGLIIHTEDSGKTWEAQESVTKEDLLRVFFVNSNSGWAVGNAGTIVHTDDGGNSWGIQGNLNALLTEIFFLNEAEGWITGGTPSGVLYHTIDGGKTWRKQETGISRSIGSVFYLNSKIGWLLAGEEIYRTLDGGKKWEKSVLPVRGMPSLGITNRTTVKTPIGGTLGLDWWYGDISFIDENLGWAVTNQEFVFFTKDGGRSWETQLDSGEMSYGFSHISFRNRQLGCVSGSTVYCTENGGKYWSEKLHVRPGNGIGLGGISLTGLSNIVVVGNNGQILKSNNGGSAWENIKYEQQCGKKSINVSQNIHWRWDNWVTNICKSVDDGLTWENQDIGINVVDLFFIDDNVGWLLGSERDEKRKELFQIIKHTTDGGKSWITQYKESLGDKYYYDIRLYSVNFVDYNNGWISGAKGRVLHTVTGGIKWEANFTGVDVNLNKVLFYNDNEGVAIGDKGVALGENDDADIKSNAVILHSVNGGKTWQISWQSSFALMSDIFFLDEENMYATTQTLEGVQLLYSNDGGRTWKERSKLIYYKNMSSLIYFINRNIGGLMLYEYLPDTIANKLLITTDGGISWNEKKLKHTKGITKISEILNN